MTTTEYKPEKHLHTYVNQEDPYVEQLLNHLKTYIVNSTSTINIAEVIDHIGIDDLRSGSSADIRSILNAFIHFHILKFDYDIRYLKLSTLGLIYFDCITYDDPGSIIKPTKFTIQAFYNNVRKGYVIDYDGFGYYGTSTKESNVLAKCDEDLIKEVNETNVFTHVYWYNK